MGGPAAKRPVAEAKTPFAPSLGLLETMEFAPSRRPPLRGPGSPTADSLTFRNASRAGTANVVKCQPSCTDALLPAFACKAGLPTMTSLNGPAISMKAPGRLFAALAHQLANLWIDEMDRATCQAAYRNPRHRYWTILLLDAPMVGRHSIGFRKEAMTSARPARLHLWTS